MGYSRDDDDDDLYVSGVDEIDGIYKERIILRQREYFHYNFAYLCR